jgi:hypothetical protein
MGGRTGSRRQNTHHQLWTRPHSYVRNLTDATDPSSVASPREFLRNRREACRFVNTVGRSPCSGRLCRLVIRLAMARLYRFLVQALRAVWLCHALSTWRWYRIATIQIGGLRRGSLGGTNQVQTGHHQHGSGSGLLLGRTAAFSRSQPIDSQLRRTSSRFCCKALLGTAEATAGKCVYAPEHSGNTMWAVHGGHARGRYLSRNARSRDEQRRSARTATQRYSHCGASVPGLCNSNHNFTNREVKMPTKTGPSVLQPHITVHDH